MPEVYSRFKTMKVIADPDGPGEGGADQAHRDATNINVILRRHLDAGQDFSVDPRMPLGGDFSTSGDFHSAMNRVVEAQQAFMEYSSKIRGTAENSPEVFLAMMETEEGQLELAAAGVEFPEGWFPDPEPEPAAAGDPGASTEAQPAPVGTAPSGESAT